MNKIIKKFLLTVDKFMSEFHLKQSVFTYSACGPFKTGHLKHFYRNELDKACFAHDAAYFDSKDLAKRTISDNILKDKAYEIARNRGYDGYKRALASMVYKLFNNKIGSGATATSKAAISVNEQLAEELHKPVTKNFKRRNVYARFKTIFGQ